MAWDAKIRPIGRPKISQDNAMGFQRLARKFVVEGTKITGDGLDGTLDGTALVRSIGEPDEEYSDHYLVDQRIEPSTSMNKAYLIREFAKIRDTWVKETISESGELKKLQRTYAVLRNTEVSLSSMSVPSLGYAAEQWALLPKQGQIANDNNDPWDLLPSVIKKTEPGEVSYDDLVPAPSVGVGESNDPALRIVWARQVEVVSEGTGGDAGNIKLKVVGTMPYRLGLQPASGMITHMEKSTAASKEVGSMFTIMVDPTEETTQSVDDPDTYSLTDKPLYSTRNNNPSTTPAGDASDPRNANNELNDMDVDDITSTFLDPDTITPVQSMFASKNLIGEWIQFDFSSATFPEETEFLEDFVEGALTASPVRWLRSSAVLDTSNPGVDVWNVTWVAPISPFWRTGGARGGSQKGPTLVNFDQNGLHVLRTNSGVNSGSATLTWYHVTETVSLNVSDKLTSEPSISMDFHIVGLNGNHQSASFRQSFSNAIYVGTGAKLYFDNSLGAGIDVATREFNSLVFDYEQPAGSGSAPASLPRYQGWPVQRTGGHLSWNNNYDISGSFPTEVKMTPIYTHNKDRIWRLEAVFS